MRRMTHTIAKKGPEGGAQDDAEEDNIDGTKDKDDKNNEGDKAKLYEKDDKLTRI